MDPNEIMEVLQGAKMYLLAAQTCSQQIEEERERGRYR
jgi:hypothetical protein